MSLEHSPGCQGQPVGGLLDDFLTDEQLAAELGISPRTLARWRRLRKAPPSVMIARRRQTRRRVAADWIKALEDEAA